MATLQGQAQFTELRSDPAFMAAPVQEKVDYLRESYLPQQDPEFAKAPRAEQEQYIHEAVLPQIQGAQAPQTAQAAQGPMFNPLHEIHKGLTTANLFAGSVLDPTADAITLGYGQSKARNEEQARKSFPGIEQDKGLLGMAYRVHQNPVANTIGTLGGSFLPYNAAEQALGQGLNAAGRSILPYTTELAQAAGAGSRLARPALNALTYLQSPALLAKMLRSGLGLGAVAAAESQPGHQLDIGRRATAGAGGFAAGAVLPPVEAVGGTLLKGGIKAVKNLFGQSETAPLTLAKSNTPQFQDYQNKVIQTFNDVKNTIMDIYHGNINHEHVHPQDAAKLARDLDVLGEGMKTGNFPKLEELTNIRNTVRRVRGKAMMKAKIEARRDINEPQGQIQQPEGQQHAEVSPQGQQQETPASQPVKEQKTLTGSVQEMRDQALQDAGLNSIDDIHNLHADIKALGRAEDDPRIIKLKEKRQPYSRKKDQTSIDARVKIDAQIEEIKQDRKKQREAIQAKINNVNLNLREVVSGGWDGESLLADQDPVDPAKQLKWDQVKNLIPAHRMADAEKMNNAMEAGKSVRTEHTAEITGSTDAAAKITNSGKVKVPVSTYTPTHWSVTEKQLPDGQKKQFVAAMGYNEAGYQHKYYVESPEGSKFKVTKNLDTEQHVGTTPNVYLGQRKYKVADVLGRAPKEEGVLTSDALAAAQSFKEIFKPENLKQFSKQTQYELNMFRKRGKFDQNGFNRLYNHMKKNPEDLKAFCNLFGLV